MSSRATMRLLQSVAGTPATTTSRRSPLPKKQQPFDSLAFRMMLVAVDRASANVPVPEWTHAVGIDEDTGRRLETMVREGPALPGVLKRWDATPDEEQRKLRKVFSKLKQYFARLPRAADRRALHVFLVSVANRSPLDTSWDTQALDALEYAWRHLGREISLARTLLARAGGARCTLKAKSPGGMDITAWWTELVVLAIWWARLGHRTTWWPTSSGWRTAKAVRAFAKAREPAPLPVSVPVPVPVPIPDSAPSLNLHAPKYASTTGETGSTVADRAAGSRGDSSARPAAAVRPRRSGGRPFFAEAATTWITEIGQRSQPVYKASVAEVFKHHLCPAFGYLRIGEITTHDVEQFTKSLESRPGRNGAISNATVTKVVGHLRRFLVAMSSRYNVAVPTFATGPERPSAASPQVFTAGQAAMIQQDAPSEYRDYIALGFATGMSTSELNALAWQDVDLSLAHIHVREALSNGKRAPRRISSQRTIHLDGAARELLFRRHAGRRTDTSFVFHTVQGKPINDGNFSQRIWAPLISSLRLPALPPSAMRSTAAARMLAQGDAPSTVARRLGIRDVLAFESRFEAFIPALGSVRASGIRKDGLVVPAG